MARDRNRVPATVRYPFVIDEVERHERDHWTATLTIYGETIRVDRRWGSWRITPEDESRYQDLPHIYAAALQEQVRRIEKAEGKASDARRVHERKNKDDT